MPVLGISYSVGQQRPSAIGVLGDGTADAPDLQKLFSHVGDRQADWAQALLSLVDRVDSVLGQHPVECVVVNSMDYSQRAANERVKRWFSIEGALLAVARRRTRNVQALMGRQIGSSWGSKAAAEELAADLLGDTDAARAGAAALAALRIRDAT